MIRRRVYPQHVSAFRDRHGKERLRYRRKGHPTYYFKAVLGSDEFLAELHACRERTAPPQLALGADRIEPGSISDLIARYYRSTRWAKKTEGAQRQERRLLEHFRDEHGHRPVAIMRLEHVEVILARKAATPSVANRLRKILRRLFAFAAQIGMRTDNPAEHTERLATPGTGYHTWTEDEIAQFESRHAIGTTPRLALALMLWTGQRRGDAIRMGPQHLRDGWITVTQRKTGTTLRLPVAPQLLEAITAMPLTGHATFLVSAYGRPFSEAGIGIRMRDWCDQAGLPQCTAHGLRKAASRRLAEIGQSNQAIKAITGHKGDSEVALYTREADQAAMARAAMGALAAWEMANRPEKVSQLSAQVIENSR